MKLIVTTIALQEIVEAKEFYALESEFLPKLFFNEIKEAFRLIKTFPKAWQNDSANKRCFFMHRFPFKIIYSYDNEEIVVVAFAHQHREPEYWLNR